MSAHLQTAALRGVDALNHSAGIINSPIAVDESACELPYRTNLRVESLARGEDVWCYHLDGSHAAIAARYSACTSYYVATDDEPNGVRLCYLAADGRCRASAWMPCLDAMTSPPPALPPTPMLACSHSCDSAPFKHRIIAEACVRMPTKRA